MLFRRPPMGRPPAMPDVRYTARARVPRTPRDCRRLRPAHVAVEAQTEHGVAMADISSAEVASVIRQAISGQIPVRMIGSYGPWRRLGGYLVLFEFGAWKLSVSNRDGAVDYIDRAVAPDGRVGDYDTWGAEPEADWLCPLRHLSPREVSEFDDLLSKAESRANTACCSP